MRARIAALLEVCTGGTAVVRSARSWDTMRDDELVGCLVLFQKRFLQRSFLVQHEAVDITLGGHQYPVTPLCRMHEITQSILSSPSEPMLLLYSFSSVLQDKTINKSTPLLFCF